MEEASLSYSVSQEEEVRDVKQKYGSECKVISDVGDFKNIVIMRPKDVNISIKFQLSATYPNDEPCVIAKSEVIPVESLPEIKDIIDTTIRNNPGSPLIDRVTQAVVTCLRNKGFDFQSDAGQSLREKDKQKPKEQRCRTERDETVDEKKPAMKTADDVIKRIQWDDGLPAEKFTIGYLDRFRGIMEKPFSEFSWDDVASVDFDVFAIPQHRIQYFKYKDLVVWDKAKRLDNIFGSTGSGIGIQDVINQYEELHTAVNEQNKKDECKEHDSVEDNDRPCDRIINRKPTTEAIFTMEEWKEDTANVWQLKQQPTHFICIRITEQKILDEVSHLQRTMVENEQLDSSCCSPPETLHVTLVTLRLTNPEQTSRACKILREVQTELINTEDQPASLSIEGVNNFHDRIICAAVHFNNTLTNSIKELKNKFQIGLPDTDVDFDIKPHLTLMKLPRRAARQLREDKSKRRFYEKFESLHLGKQDVNALYLCNIGGARRDDGFYTTQLVVSLTEYKGN